MRALEGDEGVGSNGDLQPEFEGVFAPAPTIRKTWKGIGRFRPFGLSNVLITLRRDERPSRRSVMSTASARKLTLLQQVACQSSQLFHIIP